MKTQIDTEAKGLKYEVITGLCNITPTFSFVLTVTEQATDKKMIELIYSLYGIFFAKKRPQHSITLSQIKYAEDSILFQLTSVT